ncbi:MAG TPA: PQQ-binding-like beta-propeller repeat protein [Chitinophagaceae bacterium]|nr:PQQ-binding-like beta-propeller repeat protein [Chitinophagaceae bacterium]
MKFLKYPSLVFTIIIILFISCSKNDPITFTPAILDSSKEILAFNLKKPDGTILPITVTILSDTIKAELPFGTNLINLIPEITIKGATISPASGIAQNFSSPITYTVTAQDKSEKKYVVVLTVAKINFLYIGGSNNKFYALNALTGDLIWSFTGGGSFVYSSPTYNNGVVYVGCIDSYVYAFNAITGALLWKFKAGDTGVESDAVFFENTIYVGSNDDYLYALDAATGNLKWKYLSGANISSSPIYANGIVYFGSSDFFLYALNAATGQLIWKYPTGSVINQSGATIANGIIYVGSRDAYLHAIDATTGNNVWRFSTNGVSLEQSSPTVENGVVYIAGWFNFSDTSVKGNMYAVDALTGTVRWVALENKGFSTSPFVHNNRLFICDDNGYVDALNVSNGSLIWQKRIYSNGASPIESDNIVYVGGGGSGYIYALNASSGNEIWKFPIPGVLATSSPLIISATGKPVYSGDSGNAY